MASDDRLNEADTFPRLLAENATRRPNRPASREKEYGIWQSWTWAEVAAETRALALGFMALGLEKGETVAIVGQNRPRLYWSMVAAQMVGAIPVPLYQDSVADEMAFVLDHAEAVFVIAEDQEQVDKVLSVQDRLPKIRQIFYHDPRGLRRYDHSRMHDLSDVAGRGRKSADSYGPLLDYRIARQKGGDVCVYLYTSGTTGRPKGVVLTHDNIIRTARASAGFDGLRDTDSMLAYLPMAWVGDFIFSMGQAYVTGLCVACPESGETVQQDLKEIGPTYYFAPPRSFEDLLTRIMIRMEDASRLKRSLFHYFIDHAKTMAEKRFLKEPLSGMDKAKYWLGELLVYGPLKNAIGMSRVRVGYTAGEAVGPDLFGFYRAIGINLKQLYGQTEASVFITQHRTGDVVLETVGEPTPGVEIRIDEETSEVFYRSPGVFERYHKNEEATRETKDAEGWVAAGDAGFFDERTGQLRILDRAKDVGKLADGSLFAPKYLENKLKFHPNIKEAVCFGDGRNRVMAMLVMDLGSVGNWAERNNVGYASYQELAANPRVYDMVQENVEETNRSLADDPMLAHCQIHRFLILHKELDADDGELTRTMKVRRAVINERYAEVIRALYDGDDEVLCEVPVTYEDGREGVIRGRLTIRDAKTFETAREAA